MKKYVLFFSLLVLTCSISCKKEKADECIETVTSDILSAEGPSVGSVNQDINFTLTYPIVNGCGKFEELTESIEGNKRVVTIKSKYTGCICTEVYGTLITIYTFKTATTGTYYLNFAQADGSALVDTLVIN